MNFAQECRTVSLRYQNLGQDPADYEHGFEILTKWCKERKIDPFKITTSQAQELRLSLQSDPLARRGISALYHHLTTNENVFEWDPWSQPHVDPEWSERNRPKPVPAPVRNPLIGEVAISFDGGATWEARLAGITGHGDTPAGALEQLATAVANANQRRIDRAA